MTWYPDINNLKTYFLGLKTKYSNLEDEHNLVGHHIIADKEPTLLGILDNLRHGLPMKQLDFWIRTVQFLQRLVSNHPCTEGNHRFAYISTKIFLRKNGYLLKLPDEGERFTRLVGDKLVGDKLVGGNPIRKLKFVAKWLESKCIKVFKERDIVVVKVKVSHFGERVRPVLILRNTLEFEIGLKISSKIQSGAYSIPISKENIKKGKMKLENSYVIVDHPIKIERENQKFKVAELKEEKMEEIKKKVRSLYQ